jgi:hypothetical protein
MRVVPLFETLDDLDNSAETMEALFTNPWYRGHINAQQEIMIGYSGAWLQLIRWCGWYQINFQSVYVVWRGPVFSPTPGTAATSTPSRRS